MLRANFVYIASSGRRDVHKIGHTVDPRARIAALNSFCLEALWSRPRGDAEIIETMALWYLRSAGAEEVKGREYLSVDLPAAVDAVERALLIWDGNLTCRRESWCPGNRRNQPLAARPDFRPEDFDEAVWAALAKTLGVEWSPAAVQQRSDS